MTKKKETVLAVKPVSYELANQKQIDDLTIDAAMKDLWPGAPRKDVARAIHIAKARRANPWCGDMFLTKYKTKQGDRWVVIVGQNYVLSVAAPHRDCAGWQDGVIVRNSKNEVQDLDGEFVPQGWTLVGAWCRAYHKGWQVPITKRVKLTDYEKPYGLWITKLKSLMIVKVARVQALRQMLPDRLAGMYDAAEMDQAGTVIEGSYRVVPDPEPKPEPVAQLPAASLMEQAEEALGQPAVEQAELPKAQAPAVIQQTPVNEDPKDDAHRRELARKVMAMAHDDIDVAKAMLKRWSIFKGTDRDGNLKDVFIKSFTDKSLKEKWLRRILATCRKEYKKWVKDNPEIVQENGYEQGNGDI